MPNSDSKNESRDTSQRERELELINESLRDLRFGSVTIVVQDGVVVQIDRTEKRRIRATTIS